MGINLGGQAPILNLQKNDILDLTKRNPGLKKVTLGAGWDISNGGVDFDIDIAAFMLDANNKFNTVSNIIFFNNKQGQGVSLSGDNRTGAGEGDDETINIDLDAISPVIQKIVFVVTIHEAQARRQTFGMVNNSYVRLLDTANNNRELCRFNLKDDGSTATSVLFAELYRDMGEWQFKAVGEGKIADLNGVLALFS
ncbi:TerD family protein [Romboutsia lituseburensis]|uniref:TerD family protein n=1 Tax=Romboutsia lituseburensis TaxID=1537 RepID=UPI00215B5A36|nr:TerD family protein [Romboutsia lituseburensis]MCR8743853.1 TerD family protein [Romboutsia lituseburensis]